jgi:hypothetical protein
MADKEFSKPQVSSGKAQKELDKVETQFDQFKGEINSLTLDRMNEAPKAEAEPQTKISTKEAQKADGIWLKPKRSIMAVDPKTGKMNPFNEKFRKDYEFDKEYVKFIAENIEIIGETIDIWTLPYGGCPAEWWEVPVNKPVWGPRYLAERIKGCRYHRLIMQEKSVTAEDHAGAYYGTMIADSIKQRLDAHPVSNNKSVFMGASSF